MELDGNPVLARIIIGLGKFVQMIIYYQDYSYRRGIEHTKLLSFNKVTKEGVENYCISSEAILEGKRDCRFPTLMKVETDDTISFMNPLVEALRGRE